jgi:peptidyl-tRNA hydrolase
VLQNFPKEQMTELSDFISQAGEATLSFIEDGFLKAQNTFNT